MVKRITKVRGESLGLPQNEKELSPEPLKCYTSVQKRIQKDTFTLETFEWHKHGRICVEFIISVFSADHYQISRGKASAYLVSKQSS